MTLAPQNNNNTMVISYGCRDEDDDYDSEDERQRGLFGGMLQHNKRGSASAGTGGTLSGLMEKFSASMTLSTNGEEDNSDDDGSVCSKNSVASKASQAFKKLGKKMRLGRSSGDEESDSSDSESDSDSDEESDDDETSDEEMGNSISSFAGKAVRKVTGKFTDALRLGRRSDDEDSSSDEEEEEDPLATTTTNNKKKSLSIRAFGFGNMKQDDSQGSSGSGQGNHGRRRRVSNEREYAGKRKSMIAERPRPKGRLPNRCHSTDGMDLGRRSPPLARSQTSDNRRSRANPQPFSRSLTTDNRAQMVRAAAKAKAKTEYDMEPAWAATSPTEKRRTKAVQAAAKTKAKEEFLEPNEAVWSMNVTEKMLEQATNEGIYLPPSPNKTRA